MSRNLLEVELTTNHRFPWVNQPYFVKELRNNHEVDQEKIASREKVFKHFIRYHPTNVLKPRFLTMPAIDWRLENALHMHYTSMNQFPDFIAVERELGVMERGMQYMPGPRHKSTFMRTRYGDFRVVESERAKCVNLPLETFVDLGEADFPTSSVWESVRQRWRFWTGVWMDMFCNLETLIPVLKNLDRGFNKYASAIPIAITLSVREKDAFAKLLRAVSPDSDALGRRVRMIEAVMSKSRYSTYRTVDAFMYGRAGTGDALMYTVLGVCTIKDEVLTELHRANRLMRGPSGYIASNLMHEDYEE